jgi:hypothetical protein
VSEVIDKCQEAGANLKEVRSITSRDSPLSRLSKLKRKYILRGYGPTAFRLFTCAKNALFSRYEVAG